jgi:single-strand DNA-binding protein
MASGINKAILVGRLGRDPEANETRRGQVVATLNVATGESYKDKTGQQVDKTEWHRVTVWDKQANLCMAHLRKGSQVYVEGKIQTRKWETADGQPRYTTEIVAKTVQFLGGKGGNINGLPDQPEGAPAAGGTDDLGWDTGQDETPF